MAAEAAEKAKHPNPNPPAETQYAYPSTIPGPTTTYVSAGYASTISGDTTVADDVVHLPGQTTSTITAVATWSDGAVRDDPCTFAIAGDLTAGVLTSTGPTTCTVVGTDFSDGVTRNVVVTATDAFGFSATRSVDFVSSDAVGTGTVTSLKLTGVVS
jgi:hypothetical protein